MSSTPTEEEVESLYDKLQALGGIESHKGIELMASYEADYR